MKQFFYALCCCLLVFGCSSTQQPADPIPPHDSFTVASKAVGETRTINVWVPPGYASSKDSLPVLYMADGGVKEDFPHIANTLAALIASKSITPIILVGIENTQRRRDLTGPTEIAEDKKIAPVVGGSANFRSFVKNELFAEITKRYRTTTEKGIIGESASGLFVVETFLLQPDMFDFYIAMDPSLWWNNHYLVRTAKEYLGKLPVTQKKFWFTASNTDDIFPHTNELAKILEAENIATLKWKYNFEPKETHTTIFRATKESALKWTLGK